MKVYRVLLSILLLSIIVVVRPVFAADPTLTLRPGSGKVKQGSNFTVDILIDSKGQSITLARAVLTFNPSIVEVVDAQRNESLFCSYPVDEQIIDNDTGLLMVTGFCQSGVDTPYKTSGEADVLARVTFKAKSAGDASLKWAYTGEDEPKKTVLMKDGSPPQNVLKTSPKNAAFTSVKTVTNTPTDNNQGQTPSTGFGLSIGLVISGVVLTLLGFMYTRFSTRISKSKLRTVITYDKKS